jgi:hypothetical protein
MPEGGTFSDAHPASRPWWAYLRQTTPKLRRRHPSVAPSGIFVSVRTIKRHHHHQRQRAFVTTRSGTDTMSCRSQDTHEDEITEAGDTADAATFCSVSIRGPRQVTPPSMSADLSAALALPTTFGPKLFDHSDARCCRRMQGKCQRHRGPIAPS